MISKIISTVLACVLLHGSIVAENGSQSSGESTTSAPQGTGKNKPVKITLRKEIDNQRKFAGRVVDISDAGFAIADQKSGKTTNFRYEDVQQVSQTGVSKGAIIAIVALVAGGIILGVIFHELGKD